MSNELIIFDTTLRDGEQSPGASMTKDEKLRIAKALERLKVNVIEAGFAIASEDDFLAIQSIARHVKDSRVCSLARALDKDVDRAGEAIKPASHGGRIHTFIATSPIHMQHKLKLAPDAVIDHAEKAIKRALKWTDDVEFSCEDAGRSEFDFLCRIIERAIRAGATTINIPDTVGYSLPAPFGEMVKRLIENIPNADKAIFSVHCHNDLGLAVANSLSAVSFGARQVECTINGLGERAGNCALEEIVMAIKTRSDFFNLTTRIDTTQIVTTSKLVSSITGFPVQPNKAIVGANAFAHESGIHQDGVLKHRETYEIMRAEDVGWNTNRMVLGKHSGRSAIKSRLEDLGIIIDSDETLHKIFMRFKALADKKHEIFDEDLHALVGDTQASDIVEKFSFVRLHAASKTGSNPFAEVALTIDGKEIEQRSEGSGPVDAVFRAIETVAGSGAHLELYSVNAITEGTDSQGEVTVRLSRKGRVVNGLGADTDILVASAKAYIDALNLLQGPAKSFHPQNEGL
ncbi:MAG: 2-isopropylmalate synthase [Pseudomonadota bacterium]